MATWNNTFVPLRNFSTLIKHKDEEFKKFDIPKKEFDTSSMSWIIKTQLRLNMYINDFQKSFYPKLRTAIEEEQLGNMQGQYISKILSEIPQDVDEINELFSTKILETFAMHNRNLAQNWQHDHIS